MGKKIRKALTWNLLFLLLVTLALIAVLLAISAGWAKEEAKRKERYECINAYHTFCEEWSKFLYDEQNKPKWWKEEYEEKCKKVGILEPTKEGCETISKVK